MVEEEYMKEIDPQYLLGKINMLQEILSELIYHMPERTMKDIEIHAINHARDMEEHATQTQSVEHRSYADGAKEASRYITSDIEWIIDEVQDGRRIRTVQPVIIAKDFWIDEDRRF